MTNSHSTYNKARNDELCMQTTMVLAPNPNMSFTLV